MLSAADLAACQATAGLTRTTPCQILRATPTPDGWGGQTDTWTVVSPAGLLCRVAPSRRQDYEQVQEERLTLANRYTIALPAGTDVTEKDRITALGNSYEIATVQAPRTLELERICSCFLVS
jgi:head-tail adaptor